MCIIHQLSAFGRGRIIGLGKTGMTFRNIAATVIRALGGGFATKTRQEIYLFVEQLQE